MQGNVRETNLSEFKCIKARLDALKYARQCLAEGRWDRATLVKLIKILEGGLDKYGKEKD